MIAMTLLALIALPLAIRSSQRHAAEKRAIYQAALASREQWLAEGRRQGRTEAEAELRATPTYQIVMRDVLHQAGALDVRRQRAGL